MSWITNLRAFACFKRTDVLSALSDPADLVNNIWLDLIIWHLIALVISLSNSIKVQYFNVHYLIHLGHAIVSDFHNHAVKVKQDIKYVVNCLVYKKFVKIEQVFDSNGHFLYNFGSNGEGQGQFNAPTGIAVDPFDNVLVADWGNSRIQV